MPTKERLDVALYSLQIAIVQPSAGQKEKSPELQRDEEEGAILIKRLNSDSSKTISCGHALIVYCCMTNHLKLP
jgi:hypothetical protein